MSEPGTRLITGAAFLVALAAVPSADRATAQEPAHDSLADVGPSTGWIDRIGSPQYFAVIVRDLDAAVEWYRDVLGLEEWIGSEAEDGHWRIVNLRNESLLVELIRHEEARTVDRAHGFFKVGFQVSDIEAIADRVEHATGERPRLSEFPRFGLRVLQLRDPDGNIIQVHASLESASEGTLVDRARTFRSLVSEQEFDAARAMMAPDARRWFAPREGEGQPWTIGDTGGGPWARWDEHFGSAGEVVEWTEGESSASVVVRETNDYYRLLERGPQLNRLTYHFDENGLIEGLVIGSASERDMGLTEEFRAWAQENRPEDLAELMPGGQIDPSNPERFRRLLEEWRRATDREPIE